MYKIAFKEIKGKEREKTKVIRIPLTTRTLEKFLRFEGITVGQEYSKR